MGLFFFCLVALLCTRKKKEGQYQVLNKKYDSVALLCPSKERFFFQKVVILKFGK